ncbi:MAG TPA: SagB/ThcOx family dehydrogenase [Candidatus Hydrothermia bacterium]|mgnify:CR=1 FL=1|nr:SagB/ThcOx family dehydrogenase [Candidatus Hydrothermia bacterium]HOL23793.1 SagB/ThcOx family dehydrogenase [Candidatus Hydrothermia bacterium]HPO78798.1 SagB/ThcOx family dehydrogenase [Candidatus Hydrothermia bacterium]
MKKITITLLLIAFILLIPGLSQSQVKGGDKPMTPLEPESKVIALPKPDTTRGIPVMTALKHRASVRDFETIDLTLEDISDLLWAANGINRPEEGKRTAPSAQNAQDVDLYVFSKDAIFLYNASKHQLELVAKGDHRNILAGRQTEVLKAPLIILIVSDVSRFRSGENELRQLWGHIDGGMVAQNILIFCASEGFQARPRAWMDHSQIKEVLKLSESQYPVLNIPISGKK